MATDKQIKATKLSKALTQKLAGSGVTPLEYLLRIMRDGKMPREERIKCAMAAAPYLHPKLAQVDHTHGNAEGKPFMIQASVADDGTL